MNKLFLSHVTFVRISNIRQVYVYSLCMQKYGTCKRMEHIGANEPLHKLGRVFFLTVVAYLSYTIFLLSVGGGGGGFA